MWKIALFLTLVLQVTTLITPTNAANNSSEQSGGTVSTAANLPQGITRDQAEAILIELRQIRQLLERQQKTAAQAATAQPQPLPQTVNMAIDHGWYSLGQPDAPVTIVEFADYQCPFCRRFHNDIFVVLKKNYIDTGKVRFFSRDLPLSFHQNAMKAAEASRCAGDQGKFWEMHDVLFSNSRNLSQDAFLKDAQTLGLNMSTFGSCMDGDKHMSDIQRDVADAASLQITGTPTFVVGKIANNDLTGTVIIGAQPYSVFDNAIRKILSE